MRFVFRERSCKKPKIAPIPDMGQSSEPFKRAPVAERKQVLIRYARGSRRSFDAIYRAPLKRRTTANRIEADRRFLVTH